ncbi:MAG: hypothetical protein SWE60_08685 [Thermodesulfobacteriota bacterium]|nr:hypothetical protein [Thermodesulfobacteriota bacterium]
MDEDQIERRGRRAFLKKSGALSLGVVTLGMASVGRSETTPEGEAVS